MATGRSEMVLHRKSAKGPKKGSRDRTQCYVCGEELHEASTGRRHILPEGKVAYACESCFIAGVTEVLTQFSPVLLS
jgi:hypothetical protein